MPTYCDSILLVVLGATGDLMAKKIAPALYSLYTDKKLPWNFKMLGFARKPFTDKEFAVYLEDKLKARLHLEKVDQEFYSHVHYYQGDFNESRSFTGLKNSINGLEKKSHEYCKIIFYLAVPQQSYADITAKIHQLDLDPEKISIIYEKPFGLGTASAMKLEKSIKDCFAEDHIYRIDHYLGKTIVNNVLAFRHENPLIEKIWQADDISRIEISTLEAAGVEDRGEFYETVGAFRDVGQNHLLEILSLLTATTDNIYQNPRQARAAMLAKLPQMTLSEIKRQTYRAQYIGYKNIREVDPASSKETYFKIRTRFDDERWKHMDIILEAGKGLRVDDKKFSIFFKDNIITFKLFPDAAIEILLNLKTNGHVSKEKFVFQLKDDEFQYVTEYARLFLDLFHDKKDNFISFEEVMAEWRFADPIIKAWEDNVIPLNYYEKGNTPLVTI